MTTGRGGAPISCWPRFLGCKADYWPFTRSGHSESAELGLELEDPCPSAKGDPMSLFATVNLLEIEDSVGERAPGIEGRFGRKHLDSRDLGISHFRYEIGR